MARTARQEPPHEWTIIVSETAAEMIEAISDARVQDLILDAIEDLKHEPEKKGKPMVGDLAGFRSRRVAGQRYRVLYRMESSTVTVYVVAAGIRKEGSKTDIYSLAQTLLRTGLIEPVTKRPQKKR